MAREHLRLFKRLVLAVCQTGVVRKEDRVELIGRDPGQALECSGAFLELSGVKHRWIVNLGALSRNPSSI